MIQPKQEKKVNKGHQTSDMVGLPAEVSKRNAVNLKQASSGPAYTEKKTSGMHLMTKVLKKNK